MPQNPVIRPEQVLREVARRPAATTSQVAKSLVVSYSTAKRYLVALTEQGYLTASKDYKITYQITDEGRQAQRGWREIRE